jgi:nucleotide-binding universal stress UspA family protein
MSFYSINKILVAIDLSETSLNALDTAIALAKKHKAQLQLLNVAEQINVSDGVGEIYLAYQAKADVLHALAFSLQQKHNIVPELISKTGNVTDTILTTAHAEHSDLVVMGTHGASGFREGFTGSNTYQVFKYAKCPMLAIPLVKKFTSFKNALFPIRPVSGALTRYDVACHYLAGNATLQVLGLSGNVLEKETGVLDKVVEEIRDGLVDGVNVRTQWGKGASIADDVLLFEQVHNADLLVLTSNLDAIAKPYFIGPHTQKIINCSRIPLLSIKKAEEPLFSS